MRWLGYQIVTLEVSDKGDIFSVFLVHTVFLRHQLMREGFSFTKEFHLANAEEMVELENYPYATHNK